MAGRFSIAGSVAGAALALLAVPLFAADADRTEALPAAVHASAPRLSSLEAALDAVFSQTVGIRETSALPVEAGHVLMVRVRDGKPVLACVDSHEAASRFLHAPVEKLAAKPTAEEK